MKIYKVSILLFCQVLSLAFNFFVQIILAKMYGINETGTFFSMISLTNILSVIGLFGINNYYIYLKSARVEVTNNLLKSIILIYIYINIICSIILIAVSYFRFPEYIMFATACVLLMILSNSIAISSSVIQVKDKLVRLSLLQTIIPFVKVSGLIIGFIISRNYLKGFAVYVVLITLLVLVYIGMKYLPRITQILKSTSSGVFSTLKLLLPYTLLSMIFVLYTQGNTFYLGLLTNTKEAAYFGISYLFLNMIFIFPSVIYQKVLAHKLMYFLFNDFTKFEYYYKKIQELLIIFSGIAMLVIFFISDKLIIVLFGSHYEESIFILKLLVIIIPFRLITLSISAILLNDKYVKSRLIIEGSATLINVIMNFTLIPIWGVNGAILSVIVTEFIIAIYFEKTVVKKLGVKISKILYAGLIPIYIIMYVDINVYIKTFFSILLLLIAFKMIVVRVKILWEK